MSLFDGRDVWLTEPRVAFASFLRDPQFLQLSRLPMPEGTDRLLRDSSARQYIYLFGRFVSWLDAQRLDLLRVTSSDICRFLNESCQESGERVLNSAIRFRYLSILERVFIHLEVEPNPASIAAYEMVMSQDRGRDKGKSFLTQGEMVRFMRALPTEADYSDIKAWRVMRDRALISLLLGAGLKVSEAVALKTDSIGEMELTGSVPVSITASMVAGNGMTHRSWLRPYFARDVLDWVEKRKSMAIPGIFLFPSTTQGRKMDRTSVYRIVNETFERAGIEKQREGPRTLRNTYAIRELESGTPIESVCELLGHKSPDATRRYLLKDPGLLFQ